MSEGLLDRLGEKYGTDKITRHHFGPYYESHFSRMRKDRLNILELGVGGEDYEPGGASLKMWRDYFPNSKIHGVDIHDKRALAEANIHIHHGDCADAEFLQRLVAEHGPFDIIIDDASHMVHQTLVSLFALIHAVSPGGYYVIEDIQTSYWPTHGGSSLAVNALETPISWVKHAVDMVNRKEFLFHDHYPLRAAFPLRSICVYPNIAFFGVGREFPDRPELPDSVIKDMRAADEAVFGRLRTVLDTFERNRLEFFDQYGAGSARE